MTDFEKQLDALVTEIVRRELAANRNVPTVLTVEEYAAHWKLSESTVRHAIAQGRLEVTRNGRSIRIAVDAQITRRPSDRRERSRLALLRGGTVK